MSVSNFFEIFCSRKHYLRAVQWATNLFRLAPFTQSYQIRTKNRLDFTWNGTILYSAGILKALSLPNYFLYILLKHKNWT